MMFTKLTVQEVSICQCFVSLKMRKDGDGILCESKFQEREIEGGGDRCLGILRRGWHSKGIRDRGEIELDHSVHDHSGMLSNPERKQWMEVWLRGEPTDSYNMATTLLKIVVYALCPRTGTIWTLVDSGEVMMQFKEQRIPTLMVVTCLFFLVSCVAHHADDRYRKKQEAKKHLSGSQAIEMKKTIQVDEQPVRPENVSPGEDAYQQTIRRGKALFNGKAVCFRCHGQNGDIRTVSNAEVSRLNPKPTDLRNPTDKSVRQLYLIIKYGIPATAMVPIQEAGRLSDDEVLTIISYILSLQGTRLSLDSISVQRFRRHTETDVSIKRMCDEETTGDSDRKDYCEARYAKRYLDLIIGRPPDIPTNRHIKIEARCKLQANKDLDKLVLCYRDQYSSLRKASR